MVSRYLTYYRFVHDLHRVLTRKDFACTVLPRGARTRLIVIRLVGVARDNAAARPA